MSHRPETLVPVAIQLAGTVHDYDADRTAQLLAEQHTRTSP